MVAAAIRTIPAQPDADRVHVNEPFRVITTTLGKLLGPSEQRWVTHETGPPRSSL